LCEWGMCYLMYRLNVQKKYQGEVVREHTVARVDLCKGGMFRMEEWVHAIYRPKTSLWGQYVPNFIELDGPLPQYDEIVIILIPEVQEHSKILVRFMKNGKSLCEDQAETVTLNEDCLMVDDLVLATYDAKTGLWKQHIPNCVDIDGDPFVYDHIDIFPVEDIYNVRET
jgi:hypothetical protein